MPAVVACPKCKAKYNLPDQLIGKPVQCKACSTRFQVGQPRKSLPDKSAGKAVAANPLSPQQRAEMAKLGIDGPFQPRPDLFAGGPISPADPLANHVVEDPGFATSDIEIQESEATEQEQQDDFAAVFINPAIAAPKKSKPKEDPLAQFILKEDDDILSDVGSRKQQPGRVGWLKMFLFLPVFLLAFVLSFFVIRTSMVVFGIAFLAVGIAGLVIQFNASRTVKNKTGSLALAIVAFLFSPLMLYYLIVHWSQPHPMKGFLFSSIALTVVSMIGCGLGVAALIIYGISDPTVLFE
ncbi:MAG: hypothetical protein P8K79_06890 [Mariniblastus sp.]|nr:hypothetical protein [Mariniblastus sp.]